MEKIFTKKDIWAQLEAMGAPKDKIVLAHTSLRAVGKTEGDGQGFLDALIEWFTADGGLLCIPTHTWDRLDQPFPSLDLCRPRLDTTRPATCIGTLPNIATEDPRGVRSLSPSHSMAVFGDAEKVRNFVANEEKLETPVSPGGCYAKIADQGGCILLIGVGHNKNTFLHSVEERIGVPNRISDTPTRSQIRLSDGSIIETPMRQIHAEGIPDVSANYPKFEPSFRRNGCIRDGFLGNAPTQLCDAQKLVEVMKRIFEKSRGHEVLADASPLAPEFEV